MTAVNYHIRYQALLQNPNTSHYSVLLDQLMLDRFGQDFDLSKDTFQHLPDSVLFKDIIQAVEMTINFVSQNKKILIVGDYDVDGVASTALMARFFREIGYNNIEFFIPDRFKHGYGLSINIFDEIKAINPDLIITVDNGISSKDIVQILKSNGIEVIITDHHPIKKNYLPECLIVNPQQEDCAFPYKGLSGSGVAFYFLIELRKQIRNKVIPVTKIPNLSFYLDLVAIGTIADQMQLVNVNRILVKNGIQRIQTKINDYPYLLAFKRKAGNTTFNSNLISFQLSPLLNSAGRLEHAKIAFDFIISKDNLEAETRIKALIQLNKKRKKIQEEVFEKALNDFNSNSNQIILYYHKDNHEGVLGIIANKLMEKFNRPAIVMTKNNDMIKGSSRAPYSYSMLDILKQSEDWLEEYGGHNQAAGLVIKEENLHHFKSSISNYQLNIADKKDNEVECDFEITAQYKIETLFTTFSSLEPFGKGNQAPLYLIKNCEIAHFQVFGKQHCKFYYRDFRFVYWDGAGKFDKNANRFDIIFEIYQNFFQNKIEYQLIIRKIFPLYN